MSVFEAKNSRTDRNQGTISMASNANKTKKGIAVACALSLLAGCQIAPKPLVESEISDYAATNLAQVTADQEPIGTRVTLY